ncbi:hypothetical protein [Streptosporangium amethystogenes]|uniref:hypothetical protein n=1 Tax=Streptosporangium amethystogenes TaxID=2002 RepID=UPI0004CBCEA9|nr:hypothetical protein [Streptosporangium amethystogenes]
MLKDHKDRCTGLARGRPKHLVAPRNIPREALAGRDADAVVGYDFADHGGWHADVDALRKEQPGLMDFATWLDRDGAAAFMTARA